MPLRASLDLASGLTTRAITHRDHTTQMPKLLVLFHARSPELTRVAEAITEGVRSVRFAEVDLRVLDDADELASRGSRLRPLGSDEALAAYDAILVGAADQGESDARDREAIVSLVRSTEVRLDNKVGTVFGVAAAGQRRGRTSWEVLAPMGDRGMILVPPREADIGADELESARRQGKRIADIVGWITHARSHHHHV